ncbi:hypothetical protein SAMN05216480_11535 [Pustulibacterium marinum]|uniref:Uncharacterized protein n=1 Tax=Pustulibacterium marinum TaxID=1224947 RepID=A0A1I7IDL1_9FLAO|nr:hypothetical protein [Pustulibacterium marinum]SFU71002.1 hypothetical protein SAMN05216480_11535 [Pustulibacterium marinum]
MRLKSILPIFYLLLLGVLSSCSQKGKYEYYRLFIKNNSSEVLEVITYENSTDINTTSLQAGEKGQECLYEDIGFAGYGICGIDSIQFVFPNGKGYITSIGGDESLGFGNENWPWTTSEKFINTEGHTYEFTITQEDYENAHELP